MLFDLLYLLAFVLIVVGLGGMLGFWAVGGGVVWVIVGVVIAVGAYIFANGRSRLR